MKRLAIISAGLALFSVAWMGFRADDPNERSLATVEDDPITVADFQSRYGQYVLRTGVADEFRVRRFYLDYLIDLKLAARAMEDEGIENEMTYRFERESVERKLLLDAYADAELFDTLDVREHELRSMFVRVNTQLSARHLFAWTIEEADLLYDRLQNGESFEALAREVFSDSVLANNGGLIGTFAFDEMDPAFDAAGFALEVGEISRPVRTAFGYSIIRLEDRIELPVLTETQYAEKKSRLRRYVLRLRRSEALFEHSRILADELSIVFHEPAVDRLIRQITGLALVPSGEQEGEWPDSPLVSFGTDGERVTWTVAEFRRHAAYTSDGQRAAVRTSDRLKAFLSGLIVREEMLRRARAARLTELPAYQAALGRAMEQWTYRAFHAAHEDAMARLSTLRDRYHVRVDEHALAAMRMPL